MREESAKWIKALSLILSIVRQWKINLLFIYAQTFSSTYKDLLSGKKISENNV